MQQKIIELKRRLETSKIPFVENIYEETEIRTSSISFEINAGREKHECLIIYNEAQLDYALSTKFDEFKFISGYEAVWSKENNIIEAEINSNSTIIANYFNKLYKYIIKPNDEDDDENISSEQNKVIVFPSINEIEISIGNCTPEFSILSSTRERGFRRFSQNRITIKIKNANKTTHDSAKDILEKISNSVFFQIDLAFEIPLSLQSQRESFFERHKKRKRKIKSVDEYIQITEPRYEYDIEPISLYWYAKESANMPIFQFLGYYQTIEFYFPIYSSYEAKQKIQGIIKDPRFNPNKDSEITKIINTIKTSSSNKGFGSEREQLKSTIGACLTNVDIKEFLINDKELKDFYTDHKGKGISTQKISIQNEHSDLISEICERIYQIRCRIVHSKASETDFEALLPYSKEGKLLNFDIELIEFIARKVLINSSRPLNV